MDSTWTALQECFIWDAAVVIGRQSWIDDPVDASGCSELVELVICPSASTMDHIGRTLRLEPLSGQFPLAVSHSLLGTSEADDHAWIQATSFSYSASVAKVFSSSVRFAH